MGQLDPGETLVVRGGTYREQVKLHPNDLTPGRPNAPIKVTAAFGERPVLQGLLWLKGADHWTIDGLNVTWDPATGAANEHMVKFTGATGWRLTNSEIWGARSYAGVLVAQGAVNFSIDHKRIHDTAPTNDSNQDHLIYVNVIAPTIDATAAMVRALYLDFLGRPASSSEVTHHVGRLRSGTPVGAVISEFATSDEWAGALIEGLYRSTLGRASDRAGRAYWIGLMGDGVSPASFAAEFYASDEYYRRAGASFCASIESRTRRVTEVRPTSSGPSELTSGPEP